jgi:ribonuclease HII
LAGPVVAAAVILPRRHRIRGLADSKTLSPRRREELDRVIRAQAVAVAVAQVEAEEIDRINILRATHLAMAEAVSRLAVTPDFLLVDGYPVPGLPVAHRAIPGGDAAVPLIAAASIVAKVHRDRLMEEHHRLWPAYGFDAHKGYGTAAHRRAIARHGPCPIHRRTFAGVREHLGTP